MHQPQNRGTFAQFLATYGELLEDRGQLSADTGEDVRPARQGLSDERRILLSSRVPEARFVRAVTALALLMLLSACAASGVDAGRSITPTVAPASTQALADSTLARDAHRILSHRCVVCHGCYDAPCQLVLSSLTGLSRGASQTEVYNGSRFFAIAPTRLFVDAKSDAAWRAKGFYSVLADERGANATDNLITRMLDLKQQNPTPGDAALIKSFVLDINQKRECPRAEDFSAFAKEHPLWGMPYALPALDERERTTLLAWVAAGAPGRDEPRLDAHELSSIARWESFLNQPALKNRLVARYVYEHLFLASLHFDEPARGPVDDTVAPRFFRVIRSRTKSGVAPDEIATRRPFDDPGSAPFYYRIVPRLGTVLEKTHMPYALNDARLARYTELFLEPDYQVDRLPSYEPALAANPFATYAALPVDARYRFMLDEAHFTLSGFIKGPVCRGQIALDVIEDRFWITFVDPRSPATAHEAGLLAASTKDLRLPAEQGSNGALINWRRYARAQKRHLKAKSVYLEQIASTPDIVTLKQIWDGDGHNDNAALTVLRHFDNATVVKGLVGGSPKTVWVVSYAILERIHYLLVAGFDVFGNIGHQLHTRLYMDFLRMEAEHNFLLLLPRHARRLLVDRWYRGTNAGTKDQVYGKVAHFDRESGVPYQTEDPEHELHAMLYARMSRALEHKYDLVDDAGPAQRAALEALARVPSRAATLLPELSFVSVIGDDGEAQHYSVLRDSAHTNVAHLFREQSRRRPEEDRLTVLRGFVGAYPLALFRVRRDELAAFVSAVGALTTEPSYAALRDRFGVKRTSPGFWAHSDQIHEARRASDPRHAGLFDYNRLEAR